MLNTQSKEKSIYSTYQLDIIKVWNTIQGEGPFTGNPATFVRLAGCNLNCPACDTNYTLGRRKYTIDEAVQLVKRNSCCQLVVITGGEPFRQLGLVNFVDSLIDTGFKVQIETNGTLYLQDLSVTDPNLTIVCSPKTRYVHRLLWPFIDALKYVVRANEIDLNDGLPIKTLGNDCGVARPPTDWNGQIYIQPLDEDGKESANKRNTKAAVDVCFKFGYQLSIQIHKIIGME